MDRPSIGQSVLYDTENARAGENGDFRLSARRSTAVERFWGCKKNIYIYPSPGIPARTTRYRIVFAVNTAAAAGDRRRIVCSTHVLQVFGRHDYYIAIFLFIIIHVYVLTCVYIS